MSEVACQSRRHLAARILVIILSYFLNASCKCIQNSHMYFWMESYIMMWHLLAYQLKVEKTLVADCRSDFTEARGWMEGIPLRRHIGQANIAYHPNFVLIHLEGMNLDCPSGWYSNESLALETGGSFGPFFPPSTTFRENWITDIQETSREKTSLSLDSTSLKECVSGMPEGMWYTSTADVQRGQSELFILWQHLIEVFFIWAMHHEFFHQLSIF